MPSVAPTTLLQVWEWLFAYKDQHFEYPTSHALRAQFGNGVAQNALARLCERKLVQLNRRSPLIVIGERDAVKPSDPMWSRSGWAPPPAQSFMRRPLAKAKPRGEGAIDNQMPPCSTEAERPLADHHHDIRFVRKSEPAGYVVIARKKAICQYGADQRERARLAFKAHEGSCEFARIEPDGSHTVLQYKGNARRSPFFIRGMDPLKVDE